MTALTAVILGASSDRSKFGNMSVRAHQRAGYEVFPINPKAEQIEGITAHASLSELPSQSYDRISVYLPPAVGVTMLDAIAAIEVREVWFNPGADSSELLERARVLGIPVIAGCSIVDLGMSPSEFSD